MSDKILDEAIERIFAYNFTLRFSGEVYAENEADAKLEAIEDAQDSLSTNREWWTQADVELSEQ